MGLNAFMGKHTGVASDPVRSGRTARFVLGIVITFAAWAVLVYYAIELGSQVRSGNAEAWVLLVIAVVGAICCLFLSLLLGTRIVETTRAERAARPPHPAGGRRARR